MKNIFNAADRSGAHPAPQSKCVRRQCEQEIAERAQTPFVRLRRTQDKGKSVPPGPSRQSRACSSARRISRPRFGLRTGIPAHGVRALPGHELPRSRCHKVPSKFRLTSLKTNGRHPRKVSHFFKTGLPVSSALGLGGRAWEIRPLGPPIARLALFATDTKATAGAASGAPTKAMTRTDKSVCATKARAYTALTASSFASASVAEGQLFSSGMQCFTKQAMLRWTSSCGMPPKFRFGMMPCISISFL